jgi:hypothetical protein
MTNPAEVETQIQFQISLLRLLFPSPDPLPQVAELERIRDLQVETVST